jgi:hypothetical protein
VNRLGAFDGIEAERHRAQLVRDTEDCRVAAVDEQVRCGAGPVDCAAIEVAWNVDADRNRSFAQKSLELLRGVRGGDDIDDLGLRQFGDELSRQVRIRLVRNRGLEVAYVGVDRVAEQQHLQNWQADDHAERQPVAAQLAHFLLQYRKDP